MGTGYFLVRGDKTTCGGSIIEGCDTHSIHGQATARKGDKYICGADKKVYHIAGGIPNYFIYGVQAAGTAHSKGTCPCKCYFINSFSDCIYGFESEAIKSSVSATRLTSPVHSKSSPAPKPVAPVTEPAEAPTVRQEEREPADAGFCVLPYGATPSSYEPYLFTTPPAGARELYSQLNPEMKKKPGSILIVVDPEKQEPEQVETLQRARDRIDAALEPLTVQEAKLLHDNRGAVDAFSYQLFADNLGKAGDGLGYISEIGKSYYEEIKRILVEIEDLYKNTYNRNNGVISGQEFFGQRARLFKQLDLVLTKFSKSQLNLGEYQSIKRALGLSTSSIMHRWDRTGVDNIEGYASYIEKSAKLMKIMKTVGYVGIGLDFASYTSNVYDACSKGRESECRKAAITEYSKFGFKQIGSAAVGGASGWAARGACMWILGIATSEVGAVGAGLCLITGVGASMGAAKLVEGGAEDLGKSFGGEILYEKLFK
ncbi:PAAR domain-containing protein [Enterobacter cloacae complex sp. 2022EL-00788]|uniref:PAAR domain-containing protein n=1 Tax=Enterobacter cloacae complex sp. 2022EL-00788 TaxID=2996512 RepID=UPI00226EABC7|nr:PAAR domain-containing protein [Enterobacter cloacae complex sp. 2022EL-00788]MCY0775094.1 PAAR domain-containing protein [Enterobacter cloacae complex sp. 2022EL-00788]